MNQKQKRTLYVIDASGYLYRAYFAIRNMTNPKGESTNALFGFVRSLLKMFKDFQPEDVVAVFEGADNKKGRLAIYPEYKANRTDQPKDLFHQIDWAKQFCEQMGIPFLAVPGVEADDTMGAIAKFAEGKDYDVLLCTSDKDMCQLVNDHVKILNTHKDNLVIDAAKVEEIYGVPPHLIVDWLALTGDASDNVPGVEGFGPKTASSLLNQAGSLEALLQNPDQITSKSKAEAFKSQKDRAILSRQLVSLDFSVEIPQDPDFFKLGKPNIEQLKTFYGQMNFGSLAQDLGVVEGQSTVAIDTSVTYTLVDDDAALDALVAKLSSCKEVCFDTETTSLEPLLAKVVGLGFAVQPGEAWYVPANGVLGVDKVLAKLKPLFESPKIAFYGHNVKYDMHILANYGIHIANVGFDTMLASYILNSHLRGHGLDQLSLQLFGKVKIPIEDLIGKGKKAISMADVPLDRICTYCCEDADYTCRLKQELEPQLAKRSLQKLFYEIELPLLSVLWEMERKGIYIDVERLAAVSAELKNRSDALSEEIFQIAGEAINLHSPKQVSELLYTKMGIPPPRKTATGHSTSADVLELLEGDYPIVGKILEYRGLEKLRGTYGEPLAEQVNPNTHRIHCSFNQSVAATGRLSCTDPNLQNIPVRTPEGRTIREAFKPQKKGWSYLAADYSQIELRLLAHLSEDPLLLEAFQRKQDIHKFTASVVFGVPLDQVTPEQRSHAKTVNFGVIYGQQAFGLARQLGISHKSASEFITMYFERYPKIKNYIDDAIDKARRTGKAVTLMGRERAIPEINSKNPAIRHAAERLAINTPLQGANADIIKKAMLGIDRALKKQQKLGFVVLQIHDELLLEVPDFELIDIEAIVRKEMEGVIKLKVPLVVDVAVGKNWKEC